MMNPFYYELIAGIEVFINDMGYKSIFQKTFLAFIFFNYSWHYYIK